MTTTHLYPAGLISAALTLIRRHGPHHHSPTGDRAWLYVDPDGQPCDFVAHILAELGAPVDRLDDHQDPLNGAADITEITVPWLRMHDHARDTLRHIMRSDDAGFCWGHVLALSCAYTLTRHDLEALTDRDRALLTQLAERYHTSTHRAAAVSTP